VVYEGSAVSISGLVVRRGGMAALDNVTTSIPPGTVTGLIGPSGCGKTTLMRSIVGTQRIVGGTVTVFGKPAGHSSLRTRVAYTTQAPSAYRELTVREDLEYFRAIVRAPSTRVDEILDRLGLSSLAGKPCGNLSGGQLHRVSLAAALLGEPELLVLDEPTVGLDPVLRGQLWKMFHEMAGIGTTMVISSHVMDEAEHCGNLVLLRDGQLLAAGPPQDLKGKTGAETVEEAFLTLVGSSGESR